MSFSAQLLALKSTLTTFRDVGVSRVFLPMPEELVGADWCPFVGIQPDSFLAQASNVTTWVLPVTINWFHEGFPDDIEYEVSALMWDIPQELFRHLAADEALAEVTYGLSFAEPTGSAGVLAWHAQMYAGASLVIRLKEKENTIWA
ncbi:MAG: hypothetical protein AB7G88_03400 [Thermomicrobiales bacterium]